MDLRDFADVRLPALESDEVRYNVQIAVLAAAIENTPVGFSFWNLGAPGHCAIRSPGRAMLLGNLEKSECHKLAQDTIHDNKVGVVGSDQTAQWFVERAKLAGKKFKLPIPMRIHVLAKPSVYAAIPGLARATVAQDAPVLFKWLLAFHNEAIPHEPLVTKERVDKLAESGRYLFWTVNDQPVSVAAISRRLKHSAAIGPVYTPPEFRGHGYGAAVTASVADRIFAKGKSTVSIYTDLRNLMSNRCYSKVGFKPYCDSWHYVCA